ncbi:MAG: dGTPase [Gammaproteobacteria bacterium]|jgi:dGTPase
MIQLAPYAARTEISKGRVYSEPDAGLRDDFQRDRDRIIHSSAFRRLEYKTQVFVNHEGDMFRTRLTHSLEVSQIGRTVARSLHLNEDLTEAICLAHDLGHTPFGHAGQDALNKCMKEYGGFEHNLQSLRVVDELEEKYADFPGLNLMYETREGILKHCSLNKAKTLGELGERFIERQQPGLEAQIANLADEIAYNNHDVDDGLRAGLITFEQLTECDVFKEQYNFVKQNWPDIDNKRLKHELIRRMINKVVVDVIETTKKNLQSVQLNDINDVRHASIPLVAFSDEIKSQHNQLKQFLSTNLYRHKRVIQMSDTAKDIVSGLFEKYMSDPSSLSPAIQNHHKFTDNKNNDVNRARIIADYVAGMTDRYAISESERLIS